MNRRELLVERARRELIHMYTDSVLDGVAVAVVDALLPEVTTAEGRDALPIGTVIHSASGTIACRFNSDLGVTFGSGQPIQWGWLDLPLTILWSPS